MKSHFMVNPYRTACGRKLTYHPIDRERPTLWTYSDWKYVDCSQCLAAKQRIEADEIDARTDANQNEIVQALRADQKQQLRMEI